jgi:hypothetical protein
MKYKNETQQYLDNWLQSEIYFMRFVGVAALLLAALMLGGGLFTETSAGTQLFSVAATGLFTAGGGWALWVSNQDERMASMVEDTLERSLNRVRIMAGVEIVLGVIFLISGSLAWVGLGVFSILIGGWYLRRSMKMQEFQQIQSAQ